MKTTPVVVDKLEAFGKVYFGGGVRLHVLIQESERLNLQARYLFHAESPSRVFNGTVTWQDERGYGLTLRKSVDIDRNPVLLFSFMKPNGKYGIPFMILSFRNNQRLEKFYGFAQDMGSLRDDSFLKPHRVAKTVLSHFPSHQPASDYLEAYDQYQTINDMFTDLSRKYNKGSTHDKSYRHGLGVFSVINTEYLQTLQAAEDRLRNKLPKVIKAWLKDKKW